MMILNQDKDMIANVSNSMEVCIVDRGEEENKVIVVAFGNDGHAILGRYKTAERTKEVLSEIFERMKTTGFDFTYEMPKE